MARNRDRQALRVRNTIIAFVALVAILVISYGTLYSTGVTESGTFVAGEHYRVVENPPRRRPGEPLTVTEYFAYNCVHCWNFDPLLEDWRAGLPDGIRLDRSPVAYSSPIQNLLARSYFALDQLGALEQNHERIFRAIHENGRQFLSADMMADFVDGNGTSRQVFLDAYNSAEVRRALRSAEDAQIQFDIRSTPTLVVADRYVVNMNYGRKLALDIADHLLEQELSGASAAGNEG